MKRKLLSLAIVVALGLPLLHSSAHASVVLADNTAIASNTTVPFTNVTYRGQAFTTTATEYTITDVMLLLRNSSRSTGSFALSVYDSAGAGGRPGAWVADLITGIDASTITTAYTL